MIIQVRCLNCGNLFSRSSENYERNVCGANSCHFERTMQERTIEINKLLKRQAKKDAKIAEKVNYYILNGPKKRTKPCNPHKAKIVKPL